MDEAAAGLTVGPAVAAAQRDAPPPARKAASGETSLTGRLRSSSQNDRGIVEARRARLGCGVMSAAASRDGSRAPDAADPHGASAALPDGRAAGATNDEWGV
jgi:predicted ATP-dependent serine protease